MGTEVVPPVSAPPDYIPTPLSNPISQLCFSLHAIREGRHIVSGAGVAIAPGLILTAGHVLDDFVTQLLGESPDKAQEVPFDERHCIMARHVRHDIGTPSYWNVTKYWVPKFTDLALLNLMPRDAHQAGYVWPCPYLNLLPPAVGEQVGTFGYINSHAREEEGKIIWEAEGITSKGTVQQDHPEGRDRVLLPFPCFRTNSRIDSGMSGGPVFNDAGELVGVCCRSWSEPAADGQYTAYMASIWPLMVTPIDILKPGEFIPVAELARRNLIYTRNLDRLRFDSRGIAMMRLDAD